MREKDYGFVCCTLTGVSVFPLEGIKLTILGLCFLAGGTMHVHHNDPV